MASSIGAQAANDTKMRIVRQLGSGAYSREYLAQDLSTPGVGLPVEIAVKVPRLSGCLREEVKDTIEKEAEILREVAHENVVTLIDVRASTPDLGQGLPCLVFIPRRRT